MGFLGALFIGLLIQFILGLVLSAMGVPFVVTDVIVDLALAFFFAWLNFRNDPQGLWRNLRFHRYFAFLALIFIGFTFIFGYLL